MPSDDRIGPDDKDVKERGFEGIFFSTISNVEKNLDEFLSDKPVRTATVLPDKQR